MYQLSQTGSAYISSTFVYLKMKIGSCTSVTLDRKHSDKKYRSSCMSATPVMPGSIQIKKIQKLFEDSLHKFVYLKTKMALFMSATPHYELERS